MYLLGLKQNISGENNRDITNRCDSLKEARSSRMNLFKVYRVIAIGFFMSMFANILTLREME